MHPSRGAEFAHARIDDRISRFTTLPGGQSLGIIPPGKWCELTTQRFANCIGEMEQKVVCELTPTNLPKKWLHDREFWPVGLIAVSHLGFVPDCPRTDLTKMQMGRKPRRPP